MWITRWTLDRWILEWRQGGFDALPPSLRQSQPCTPPEVVELAMALKKENPDRAAAQVRRILRAQLGWAPDERTLQRMFHRTGLIALKTARPADAFGRFEADRPNELWVGDALHGLRIDGRKMYLFAFLDDHARAVVGHCWGFAQDTGDLPRPSGRRLASGPGRPRCPAVHLVDNGSAFVDSWLLRACAKLGIKLVHSVPGRPEGRGRIERFFRTVNGEFTKYLRGCPGLQAGEESDSCGAGQETGFRPQGERPPT
ncbi:DDE-type integrase/transposase/recombinase [Streptomyces chiangmaiensis]